jgi:uncharacterized membrane protein YfcA
VILSTTLVLLCDPRRRFTTILCFIIPAVAVPIALFALGASSGVLRYSAQGPIIWFVVWLALLLAAIGIIAGAFTVGAIRKRLIQSSRDGAATRAI